MSDEEFFLIKVLRDYINQSTSFPGAGIDWDRLYSLSKNHEVTGIVYHQCKTSIPVEYEKIYEKNYAATVYYFSNHSRNSESVYSLLKDNEICFFTVKGLEVARYYPIPMLRTMGDADVVVEPKSMQKAIRLLTEYGAIGNTSMETDSWSGKYNGLSIEIHSTLVKRDEYLNESQEAFFNDYLKYVHDNHIDWSFHFLFLIMHLRKHFIGSGVGFRQFMDIAVLIKSNRELDWNWIGLTRF